MQSLLCDKFYDKHKKTRLQVHYHILKANWQKIYTFLKAFGKIHVKNKAHQTRRFIEAVYFQTRTGCQWRMLPPVYGHYRSVHKRFKYWSELGVWEKLMQHVSDIDPQDVMLDTSIVRANACAAGYEKGGNAVQGLGRSKGGFTTKIHALADALGNLIRFWVTPGQVHDVTQAALMLKEVQGGNVLADKAYFSRELIEGLTEKGCCVVIPARANARVPYEIDRDIYKERHLIENLFAKLKQFRRIFSRFDKTICSFMRFLHFAGALIWMR